MESQTTIQPHRFSKKCKYRGADDDSFTSFFNELVASHEYEELDFWPVTLTPTEIMNSIASFYNSFMQYRDLLFVKKKLESIVYDVTNYAALVQFCKE